MTIEEIKAMVDGEDYEFLRSNPHLAGRILFLTLGGSYAYGTNIETSDVDVRGCAMNSKTDILGLSNFEQVVNTQTDTTIYSFNKLVSLLLNCNPNTIEMLGCKSEHYFYISDVGQMIQYPKNSNAQRYWKKHSNRIVRRSKYICGKGNQYRKHFEYWWTLY